MLHCAAYKASITHAYAFMTTIADDSIVTIGGRSQLQVTSLATLHGYLKVYGLPAPHNDPQFVQRFDAFRSPSFMSTDSERK